MGLKPSSIPSAKPSAKPSRKPSSMLSSKPSDIPLYSPPSLPTFPPTQAPTFASKIERYSQELIGPKTLTIMNATQKKWFEDKVVEIASQQSYSTVKYTLSVVSQKLDNLERFGRKLNTNTNTKRLTIIHYLETIATNRTEAILANYGIVQAIDPLREEIRQFMNSIEVIVTKVGPIEVLQSFKPSYKSSDRPSLQLMSNSPTFFPFMLTSKPQSTTKPKTQRKRRKKKKPINKPKPSREKIYNPTNRPKKGKKVDPTKRPTFRRKKNSRPSSKKQQTF